MDPVQETAEPEGVIVSDVEQAVENKKEEVTSDGKGQDPSSMPKSDHNDDDDDDDSWIWQFHEEGVDERKVLMATRLIMREVREQKYMKAFWILVARMQVLNGPEKDVVLKILNVKGKDLILSHLGPFVAEITSMKTEVAKTKRLIEQMMEATANEQKQGQQQGQGQEEVSTTA